MNSGDQDPSGSKDAADNSGGTGGTGGDSGGGQPAPTWAAASIGFELAAGVAGMCLLGYLLDRWLDTAPWLLLTGALVGIAAGLFSLIRAAMRIGRTRYKTKK